jgi:hypothetical protein
MKFLRRSEGPSIVHRDRSVFKISQSAKYRIFPLFLKVIFFVKPLVLSPKEIHKKAAYFSKRETATLEGYPHKDN